VSPPIRSSHQTSDQVSGRTFPVDVLCRPPRDDETDLAEAVANEYLADLLPRLT
jgi:HrpA-like RNA helicase